MSSNPVAKAMAKPPMAVVNHPMTTVMTPVMRYTALSRPHALSASDDPMATIKQTYVVERGSLSDVASDMSNAEVVRFTVARIMS